MPLKDEVCPVGEASYPNADPPAISFGSCLSVREGCLPLLPPRGDVGFRVVKVGLVVLRLLLQEAPDLPGVVEPFPADEQMGEAVVNGRLSGQAARDHT
jgi:hypothetical protein